jgi:hypothetical protein
MECVVLAISPHIVDDAGDGRLSAIYGVDAIEVCAVCPARIKATRAYGRRVNLCLTAPLSCAVEFIAALQPPIPVVHSSHSTYRNRRQSGIIVGDGSGRKNWLG